jgi:hypothetical protein
MKLKQIILVCLSLGVFSSCAFAEIYRSTDADGTVIYSDQPHPKSEAVSLPSVNIATQSNAQNTNATTDSTNNTKKKIPYTQFKITSPTDQDTFQNATEIPVTISITPALQEGDKIQFYLDGKAVSEPIASTSYSIPKIKGAEEIIERGSHSISAELLNEQGEVIKTTPSVTIHAHYVTLFSPSRP